MVSGAPPSAFWGANFSWDMLSFCLPATGIVALVAAYQQPQLRGVRLAALAVLLPAFGAAGITATYMAHFLFKVGWSLGGGHTKSLQARPPRALNTRCRAVPHVLRPVAHKQAHTPFATTTS